MKEEKIILSIIVPIYNVEKYLAKCIDSLLEQDIDKKFYEIILVNDGSSDNSKSIASVYEQNNENIILISQGNMGLSVARNIGIKKARGKYIQFVDSDDFLVPFTVGKIIDYAERFSLDVLRFDYQYLNEEYEVIHPYRTPKLFVDYSNEICDGVTFLEKRLGYACYACQFLIRRDIIVDNDLYFCPNIYFEDTEWTPRMLVKVNRVASTSLIVYNYLMRPGSITIPTAKEKIYKLIDDRMFLISQLQLYNAMYSLKWYRNMIARTVLSLLADFEKVDAIKKKKSLMQLKGMNIFPLSCNNIAWRAKVKIGLINISPNIYMTLMGWYNKCML